MAMMSTPPLAPRSTFGGVIAVWIVAAVAGVSIGLFVPSEWRAAWLPLALGGCLILAFAVQPRLWTSAPFHPARGRERGRRTVDPGRDQPRVRSGRGGSGIRVDVWISSPLELFFIGLLGLASLAIVFISGVVVKNLYRGQR